MSEWDSEVQTPSPHVEPLDPERIDTTELFEDTTPEERAPGDWRTDWAGSPEQAEQAAMVEQYQAEQQQGGAVTESSTSDTPQPFDPSTISVDGVIEYVDEHPEELDAVYAAEEAGKARSTLLAQLDAMRA